MAIKYSPDGNKVFASSTRTVFLPVGVRLSCCGFERCPFPTLVCSKCHYSF